MEEQSNEMTIEDIYKKQRQERKDLQAQIQVLKKSATKGDKKKKKEVAEAIALLECELERKHLTDLCNVQCCDGPDEGDVNPNKDILIYQAENVEMDDEEPEIIQNKVSRAQKRRNKKQSAEKERENRIAEQEEMNKDGPRMIEINTIKSILESEGLQIHSIPADGNCLYCAINHQLDVTGRTSLNVPKLRKLTASFIRDNKDEFLPFMYNEDDDIIDEIGFEKYCKDIASTKLWGGHVELSALSTILQCPIKVIQASGPSTLQGEAFVGPPLILTYHKHLYRLGEHYNSTIKISQSEDPNENENFVEI